MSQSLPCHAFGVREGCEYRSTKYVEGHAEFHLAVKDEAIVCPHCRGGSIGGVARHTHRHLSASLTSQMNLKRRLCGWSPMLYSHAV